MSEKAFNQVLFGQLNLDNLEAETDFKEDSVREVIILPILKELGYSENEIVRSKTLEHPFLKIGSKKRRINLIPDYVLTAHNRFAWVLDAKAPTQKVVNDDNVEQVYSYATHPEIRSKYFALCNGVEFALYRTSGTNVPLLFFPIAKIGEHWKLLELYLSPKSFQLGKEFEYDRFFESRSAENSEFDYAARPLLSEIIVKKRACKRHFGVHGYFTKQSWNVVAEYIKNFSQKGDLVLDPFGGSGVTGVEALMNGRKTVSVDLNPMAVFIVQALIAPIIQEELAKAYYEVVEEYERLEPISEPDIKKALKQHPGPTPIPLPEGSDVKTADKLFSPKQTAQLGLLKSIILKQKNDDIRNTLLLMFSGLVTKANLTYHTSTYVEKEGGGDAAAFRYYRYRIAPHPVEIGLMKYFRLRYQKVAAAKKEMEYFINQRTISQAEIIKGTATNLSFLKTESVDYIYTDPPYGTKIPYLDLSAMWNAWLGLEVSEQDFIDEAIEGGEHDKSKQEYNDLIAESIREMYRVLKFNRWLSFVFAHKDPEFWHLIIDTAESCGFEYIGAVPQKNGQTSFKKRQNPFTVLSGQLIINFRKVKNPRAIMKANLGMGISEIVLQTIEGIIARDGGATLEQINDELIIKGLELGFLDLLKKEYSDLTPFLLDNFGYDEKTEQFSIKKDTRFTSHLDVKLRIKYYLISFLRRKEMENVQPHFDEIVLAILPLLRNGTTPENQTILSVLEDIGNRIGEDSWRLKETGQPNLFG